MHKASFILGLHAFGVIAITWRSFALWGLTLDSVLKDKDARDAVVNASRDPTLSRSVTFKPFQQYWDSLSDDSVLRDSEWTWRINITNIAAPDADSSNTTEDTHVVAATYDFTWPVNGNISAALDNSTSPFCITALGNIVDLPVNATNAYEEDTGTGCVPVLGKGCVDALLARAPVPSAQSCNRGATTSWSTIPECRGSFGVSARVQGGSLVATPAFDLSTNASQAWESGQGFFWELTEPVNGTDSQQYHNLGSKVHIMMMYTDLAGGSSRGATGPQLLCSRVNLTKLPENDANGDGVALTGESVLESSALGIFERFAGSNYLWAVWPTVLLVIFTFLSS
ncbi:hypothetical protein F4859DRAFT_516978 [Xylaria cf. heliscus]|nr:hypothetical protein F4859DRAFT_516978 [Xylaria cf. heliscus]